MINLGDEVEDIITGFRGIAIARHTYIYGNPNISIQPLVDRYGILPEPENFKEEQLKIIKVNKINKKPISVKEIKNNFQPIKNTDYVFGGHTDKEN